jgi:hypothetical protein
MKTARRGNSGRFVRWLFGACTLAAAHFATPAYAGLGDEVASVEKDRVGMQAKLHVSKRANYDVHELALETGATVREFVGQDNKVFAVSWSGGWRPNLRDLFSKHYDRYIEGTRGLRHARGPVRIELPGMVIFMGGHLRHFFGYAYLTEQVPAGFLPEEVK